MTARPIIISILWMGALASFAVEPTSTDTFNFEHTRSRIDALFRGRGQTTVLPSDLPNPFNRASDRPRVEVDPATVADPANKNVLSDREMLERLASAVQVRGILETGGHPAIIIGRRSFNEGDALSVSYGATKLEVTIKRITTDTFTLGYKEAELTLRLPR